MYHYLPSKWVTLAGEQERVEIPEYLFTGLLWKSGSLQNSFTPELEMLRSSSVNSHVCLDLCADITLVVPSFQDHYQNISSPAVNASSANRLSVFQKIPLALWTCPFAYELRGPNQMVWALFQM